MVVGYIERGWLWGTYNGCGVHIVVVGYINPFGCGVHNDYQNLKFMGRI